MAVVWVWCVYRDQQQRDPMHQFYLQKFQAFTYAPGHYLLLLLGQWSPLEGEHFDDYSVQDEGLEYYKRKAGGAGKKPANLIMQPRI